MTETPLHLLTGLAIKEQSFADAFADAMEELAELDDYANDEGIDPPSPVAKKIAENVLKELAGRVPRDYSVSLWEDGDVVVYTGNNDWRVSVFCRANGGVSFYVNSSNHQDQEEHYDTVREIPFDLIVHQLKKFT